MSPERPPFAVLHAFGVEGSPRPIVGGMGTSWRAGDLVFKPEGGPVYEWLAEAMVDIVPEKVRLAAPVATRDGAWTYHGWSATQWVEGSEPDRSIAATCIQILEAGRAFHHSVAHLAQPECLDERWGWWALADRAAWGERAIHFCPEFADLARRLQVALEPLGRPQLVHGDLTGNVLLHPDFPPAVLDISPYWRPTEYAEGIVVADALCWHGADASLIGMAGVSAPAVARALLFRMATTNDMAASGAVDVNLQDEARRYEIALAALGL